MKSACPPQRRGCIARKRRADPLCARSPSPGAANALHFVLHTHLKIRYFYKNIFRKVSYMIPKNRADIRKNKESLIFNGSLFGLGERIRTSGLLNPIQARYQTALHPEDKNYYIAHGGICQPRKGKTFFCTPAACAGGKKNAKNAPASFKRARAANSACFIPRRTGFPSRTAR